MELVVVWLVAFLVLGAVALPVTTYLLPRHARGALSFPAALTVLAVVGHLVGHLAFGWPALLAGLVVLGGGALPLSRRVDPDLREFAEAGAVFTAAFLFMVAIRAVTPAAAPLPLGIGEKFLDLGLLATLSRSGTLPPQDMWFAGESVRYYYGGHMTTVLLSTLTGTEPRFAYNLGVSGFYAMLVTAAYGLAGAIGTGHGVPRRLAGGLGAFFVGLAGNLATPTRVLAWLLPADLARWFATQFGLDPEVAAWTPSDFWYFEASRVLPTDPRRADPILAATEFPLFAWLNGDFHAHMMAQAFVLLAATLLLAYWRADDRQRQRLLLFGALPPVAGLVGFINVWSFPSVGGLTVLAVAFAPTDPAELLPDPLADRLGPREEWFTEEARRVGLGVASGVVVLLLGMAWTLPFWLGPRPHSRGIAFWEPWSPLGGLLLVHGAFLAMFVPYLARRAGWQVDQRYLVGVAVAAFVVVLVLLGAPALGLFVPPLAAAWWLLRTRTDVGFETVLILGGLGLVLLVELVTVEGERFNTIFKPYVEVWLFWAIAAGVVLPRLADGAAARAPDLDVDVDRERWQRTGTALALALVLTTGLYAGFALPTHFENPSAAVQQDGATLDATAYLEVHYAGEAPAIRWLNQREGQPTIVTAAPGGYWWRPERGQGASAAASLTGLPTVLGWFHERQYRGPEPYRERLQHVETIYEGPPERQAELLERYDVQYVYVGPAERATYDVTIGEHPAVEPAFQGGNVTVYAVET